MKKLLLVLLASALCPLSPASAAVAKLQVDTKTHDASIEDGSAIFNARNLTVTLKGFTITDAAGVQTIVTGSTSGVKFGDTGNKIGFLGATPIVRPSATTDLRLALINIGLYTTGGASPLNLNGGAFTSGPLTSTTIAGTAGTFSSTLAVTGNATFGGTFGITGNLTGSNAAFSGNETIGGTLGVTGAITGPSLTLSGNGSVGGNLTVTGTTTHTGAINGLSIALSGNETVGGTFGVTGATTLAGLNATAGTFSGTLGVTGATTISSLAATTGTFSGAISAPSFGAVNATTGTFSGAISSTTGTFSSSISATNAVLSGTLNTGALTGTTAAFSGNSTIGGTLGVTGAFTGSSAAFSGNETVGGTFGVTGATSGSSFVYTGNGTVGGTLGVTGQIANLPFIDVSRAPYNADMTGTADGTSALNSAITAAQAGGLRVFIPRGTLKITSTITITAPVEIFGVGNGYDAYNVYAASPGTVIKWAGSSGGTMVRFYDVNHGGHGMSRLRLDGNSLAGTNLELDGSIGGYYCDITSSGFTTGSGIYLHATDGTCSWNTFVNPIVNSGLTGIACIRIGGVPGSNAAHNVIMTPQLNHAGTCAGILLGGSDNNDFYSAMLFNSGSAFTGTTTNGGTTIVSSAPFFTAADVDKQVSGTGPGFASQTRITAYTDSTHVTISAPATANFTGALLIYPFGISVDPTEATGFPAGNNFFHLQAGSGGWRQPASTTYGPATIYGYAQDNGQPDPVTHGTGLCIIDPIRIQGVGAASFTTLTVGSSLRVDSNGLQITHGFGLLAAGANNNVTVTPSVNYMTFTGATGAYSLGGFSGGVDGRILYANFNIAQTLTLKHDDSASSVGNRISIPSQTDITFPAGSLVRCKFVYDQSVGAGAGYWVLFSTTVANESWIAPTLAASWANVGGTSRVAGYRRNQNNQVWLRGLISGGTTTDSTTLFTLPAGYRPSATEKFSVDNNGTHAEVAIFSDGTVKIFGVTSNVQLSLAGISFSAD